MTELRPEGRRDRHDGMGLALSMTERGRPSKLTNTVVELAKVHFLLGSLGIRSLAKVINVADSTVRDWVRQGKELLERGGASEPHELLCIELAKIRTRSNDALVTSAIRVISSNLQSAKPDLTLAYKILELHVSEIVSSHDD